MTTAGSIASISSIISARSSLPSTKHEQGQKQQLHHQQTNICARSFSDTVRSMEQLDKQYDDGSCIAKYDEIIKTLRTDLFNLTNQYKEESYRNKNRINKLAEERDAFALRVEVLEKVCERFRNGVTEGGGVGGRCPKCNLGGSLKTAERTNATDDQVTSLPLPSPPTKEREEIIDRIASQNDLLRTQNSQLKTTISNLESDLSRLHDIMSNNRHENAKLKVEELTQDNIAKGIKIEALEREFEAMNQVHEDMLNMLDLRDKDVVNGLSSGSSVVCSSSSHPGGSNGASSDGVIGVLMTKSLMENVENLMKEQDETILKMKKANEAQEKAVAKLNADLVNARMTMKSDAYRSQKLLQCLQDENMANSIKVAVFERELNDRDTEQNAVANRVEEDLRREIEKLTKERDRLKKSLLAVQEEEASHAEANDADHDTHDDDLKFMTEEDYAHERALKSKDLRIALLEKSNKVSEQTIKSLKSELVRAQMKFKSESYQSRRELRDLQDENTANSIKVAVFERELCDKEFEKKAVASRVEEDLRREVESLRAEREEFLSRSSVADSEEKLVEEEDRPFLAHNDKESHSRSQIVRSHSTGLLYDGASSPRVFRAALDTFGTEEKRRQSLPTEDVLWTDLY